ncbi:hypothetical protein SAMN05428997_11128 [Bosea sp. CRIB-10]|uniref:hypothetical protein n=1 Tax=Bosea sp. CRIB-10 TaxID=378404 RepID=UPI0008EC139C|nr:hypothetical protein [Bosea sp. CRIB-10]SFC75669.1 hypothetical protein SAMN05428997_11128 [Bosea sp. CRIB-10]
MPKQGRTDPVRIFPTPTLARDLPPFWELEQLLREGFDHDSALAELARRRESWSSGRRPPPVVAQSDSPDSAFTIAS